MAKLNSDDPLYDKDVVNLRTLNSALKKVEDSTLTKILQKFKDETLANNDTLFAEDARLGENGGVVYSGGTDLYDIFRRKDYRIVESFDYNDENIISLNVEGENLEILINKFNDLLIKGDLNVEGDIKHGGESLEDIFVKKEDFLQKEFKEVFVETSTPRLYNFNETPDGIRVDFTSEVFYGSEIIFLNGLMQRKELDYEVIDGEQIFIRFSNPPQSEDLINIYGVKFLEPQENLEFIDKETPEGEIDGINKIFLLNNKPKTNSEHVYLNGLLQDSDDYTIEENKITFNIAPFIGSKIKCTYRY